MDNLPIRELITLLEQELIRVGYKDATLNYYRDNWKRIIAYFDEHGEKFFSETTAMQYVDTKCDFFAKEKAGSVKVAKVNVDENQGLSMKYNVRAIPALLFFKNGQLRDQIVGMTSKKDLLGRLEALA